MLTAAWTKTGIMTVIAAGTATWPTLAKADHYVRSYSTVPGYHSSVVGCQGPSTVITYADRPLFRPPYVNYRPTYYAPVSARGAYYVTPRARYVAPVRHRRVVYGHRPRPVRHEVRRYASGHHRRHHYRPIAFGRRHGRHRGRLNLGYGHFGRHHRRGGFSFSVGW